ncbi:MAG: hypothetical protein ACLUPF_06600 [Dorea sp.]
MSRPVHWTISVPVYRELISTLITRPFNRDITVSFPVQEEKTEESARETAKSQMVGKISTCTYGDGVVPSV